jgi:hypothetical protein
MGGCGFQRCVSVGVFGAKGRLPNLSLKLTRLSPRLYLGGLGRVGGGLRRIPGKAAAQLSSTVRRRPLLSQGRFALQEQIVRYTWDRAFGDWEVREMTALEVLQSVQYVTVKGKRLAVVGAEDWEVVIEWLETLEDIEAAREAHEALKAAGGDRDRAGWLRWDEVKEELA